MGTGRCAAEERAAADQAHPTGTADGGHTTCGEITYRNFKVLQADPRRFDGDKDEIGCET